jgi:hypothetical protein
MCQPARPRRESASLPAHSAFLLVRALPHATGVVAKICGTAAFLAPTETRGGGGARWSVAGWFPKARLARAG